LQQRGVKHLVVTRGGAGALLITAEGAVEHVPGQKVNVVDTTGAGDAFTCALGVALAEGQSLTEAARFATGAGALACTKLGVIPALAYRPEVEALLRGTL
jgi:ribokinase